MATRSDIKRRSRIIWLLDIGLPTEEKSSMWNNTTQVVIDHPAKKLLIHDVAAEKLELVLLAYDSEKGFHSPDWGTIELKDNKGVVAKDRKKDEDEDEDEPEVAELKITYEYYSYETVYVYAVNTRLFEKLFNKEVELQSDKFTDDDKSSLEKQLIKYLQLEIDRILSLAARNPAYYPLIPKLFHTTKIEELKQFGDNVREAKTMQVANAYLMTTCFDKDYQEDIKKINPSVNKSHIPLVEGDDEGEGLGEVSFEKEREALKKRAQELELKYGKTVKAHFMVLTPEDKDPQSIQEGYWFGTLKGFTASETVEFQPSPEFDQFIVDLYFIEPSASWNKHQRHHCQEIIKKDQLPVAYSALFIYLVHNIASREDTFPEILPIRLFYTFNKYLIQCGEFYKTYYVQKFYRTPYELHSMYYKDPSFKKDDLRQKAIERIYNIDEGESTRDWGNNPDLLRQLGTYVIEKRGEELEDEIEKGSKTLDDMELRRGRSFRYLYEADRQRNWEGQRLIKSQANKIDFGIDTQDFRAMSNTSNKVILKKINNREYIYLFAGLICNPAGLIATVYEIANDNMINTQKLYKKKSMEQIDSILSGHRYEKIYTKDFGITYDPIADKQNIWLLESLSTSKMAIETFMVYDSNSKVILRVLGRDMFASQSEKNIIISGHLQEGAEGEEALRFKIIGKGDNTCLQLTDDEDTPYYSDFVEIQWPIWDIRPNTLITSIEQKDIPRVFTTAYVDTTTCKWVCNTYLISHAIYGRGSNIHGQLGGVVYTANETPAVESPVEDPIVFNPMIELGKTYASDAEKNRNIMQASDILFSTNFPKLKIKKATLIEKLEDYLNEYLEFTEEYVKMRKTILETVAAFKIKQQTMTPESLAMEMDMVCRMIRDDKFSYRYGREVYAHGFTRIDQGTNSKKN